LFAQNNAHVDACRVNSPDISAHPHVIAISSADHHGVKVPRSAYGDCLKLLGPTSGDGGVGIATTDRTGDKGFNTSSDSQNFEDKSFHKNFFGTSAAAPIVAGAFGLLYSLDPDLSAEEAEKTMLDHAAKVSPDLADYDAITGRSHMYGFGRVDLRFLRDY